MSDLPDWVTAVSNTSTVLFNNAILNGGAQIIPAANNGSLVLNIQGLVANTLLNIGVTWYTDAALTIPVNNQQFTGTARSSGATLIVVESPVYGAYARIVNNSGQSINLVVIGSARIVPQVRYLNSNFPAARFGFAGVFNAGVPITLPSLDGGTDLYTSNAQSTINLALTAIGDLSFTFIDRSGGLVSIVVAHVTVVAAVHTTIGLPPGPGQFVYTPTATAAGQFIIATAMPAQL